MKKLFYIIPVAVLLLLASCGRGTQDTGREYAPQMYHSEAYEPLSQITSKDHGDEYNSNPNNPYSMNMRLPARNTIKRLPNDPFRKEENDVPFVYHIHKDSFELAGRTLVNPLDSSTEVIEAGKVLYGRYCQHCHGETGQGDGLVGEKYKGVPSYSAGRVKEDKAGHIFHTITFGRNRMWPHASQVSVEDRWKIVHYVQVLQKQQ